jgi:transcriptional regulator with XRE-family HTH domain
MPAEALSRQARADTVRLERLRLRLVQKDIAKACGFNQGTISKAENGTGADATYEAIEAALAKLAEGRA